MKDDELMHYGILGMKWGQRNGPPYPLGSSQMSAKERREEKKRHAEEQRAENYRKKAMASTDPAEVARYAKYLTDEELQNRISRIKKERELTGLFQEQIGTKYFNGKKAVGEIATSSMKGVGAGLSGAVSTLVKATATHYGKKFVESVVGEDEYKEIFGKSGG